MIENEETDDRDEALLNELRGAFARIDPVPDLVVRAGHAAIEFRDLDSQLAELLSDSATEDPALAGIRGEAGRMLTFGFGERFIEIEVSGTGAARDATGYIVPGGAGRVIAETSTASAAEAEVDDRGRFRLLGLPGGPTRLRVELVGVEALVTPWTAF